MDNKPELPVPHDVPIDPVVPAAVRNAVAATEPPHRSRRSTILLYVFMAVLLVIGTADTTFSALNSHSLGSQQQTIDRQQQTIAAQQQKITQQEACIVKSNKALSDAAQQDRNAVDDLFTAILGAKQLTALQVQEAYANYKAERAANDRLRQQNQPSLDNC